jgi:hypothetical protein
MNQKGAAMSEMQPTPREVVDGLSTQESTDTQKAEQAAIKSPEQITPKVVKEPKDMTFEEFSEEYNRVMRAVAEKEKLGGLDPNFPLNYRPITPEEQVLLERDWKEFSRQRGFSEEDIAEYERWLALSGQRDNLPGAINDPWRRERPNWEQKLYDLHTGQVQSAENAAAATPAAIQEVPAATESNGMDESVW